MLFKSSFLESLDFGRISVFDFEVIQQGLVLVLANQAGVNEISIDMPPFAKASVVEEFEFFGDDEGDDATGEALLEHNQAADAAVAVLKGMDALELAVEVDDVFQ